MKYHNSFNLLFKKISCRKMEKGKEEGRKGQRDGGRERERGNMNLKHSQNYNPDLKS